MKLIILLLFISCAPVLHNKEIPIEHTTVVVVDSVKCDRNHIDEAAELNYIVFTLVAFTLIAFY